MWGQGSMVAPAWEESLEATILLDLSSIIFIPKATQVTASLSKGRQDCKVESLCLKSWSNLSFATVLKETDS